jgi:predicted  nucleic acid-binding Zn-ribbon protein
MQDPDKPLRPEPKPKRSIAVPLLSAGLLLAGAAIVYQGIQTSDLKHQFAATQHDNAVLRATLSNTDSELRRALGSLQDELAQARQETDDTLAKARTDVTRHADALASRLAKKAEEQAKQITAELGKVKEDTEQASTQLGGKIDGITTQVGSVQGDVATAKTDIQSTKDELQRTKGDLGMMSGLIATNSKQIQVLRDLGDRNIYQFSITKSGSMQKVGDIQVMLRKADPRHNRYSVEVLADDKFVDKKDRSINEPVQFYTAQARQPYELVVNQVQKDRIEGYLATPKVTVSRNQPPAQ